MAQPIAQANLLEQVFSLRTHRVRRPHRYEGKQHVSHGRQVMDQVELLKDKPELFAPHDVLFLLLHRSQHAVIDGDGAGRGDIERAQKVQKRALARAGGTDNEREGPGWNVERHAAQGVHLFLATLIVLSQVRDANHAGLQRGRTGECCDTESRGFVANGIHRRHA